MLKQLLVSEIKSKKQISDLPDDFNIEKIEKFFSTNGDIRKKLEQEFETKKEKIVKSKSFKEVVKRIREEIGIVYGSFLTSDFTKLEKKTNPNEILLLHKSTRERLDFYEEIYEQIFNWYKPNAIGDLACGLNPISYSLMKTKAKYFASDLNPKDMNAINNFFKENKINGIAKAYDITKLEFINEKEFKECDLVFLFKALDSFEFVNKNISKEILEKLPQKNIVVSFPTKSLVSKREFKQEKRNWFKNFLEQKEWKYEKFEIENEEFYLISKTSN